METANDPWDIEPQRFQWDIQAFEFIPLQEEIYGSPLRTLHERIGESIPILEFQTDQSSVLHKMHYGSENAQWLEEYRRFCLGEIAAKFTCDVIFQRIPSFRVQVPGNIAVAEFHSDSEYGHDPNDVNIYLPLTDAPLERTILIGDDPANIDLALTASLGQYWIWKGSTLRHGNAVNTTDFTRVSIDFRVLPKHLYRANTSARSVSAGRLFALGDYWTEFT